jgi:protein O-mannosyl-transferase
LNASDGSRSRKRLYNGPLERLPKGISAELLANPREFAIAACLFFLVLGVYFPVRHFDFFNLDDRLYVSGNDRVMNGVTADGLRWALTCIDDANWFPLTRISFMVDRQLFGPKDRLPPSMVDAGPYHWTNVLIHAFSVVLLFGLLRRLTGALWPSAFVAFLFALHPQHVESVAWVAERKDVLCALFWMLALWSYAAYAKRPRPSTYLLTLLLYCLGLMSKPMMVTLPAILLLLDIWPLERFPGKSLPRLLWEKAAFVPIAIAMSAVTVYVQNVGGAVRTLQQFSPGVRIANVLISAVTYVGVTFWPARLAVYYPMPESETVWQAAVAGAVLLGVTALVLLAVRTRPYLTVGWLWFAITVLPVIGIIQVGYQMRADRYTYLPTIGISIMVAWGAVDLVRNWPITRPIVAALGGAACVACIGLTWTQLSYWKSSLALWQHTIAVTDRNFYAHSTLGIMWQERGLYDDAISEYRKSLAILAVNPGVQDRLGKLLYLQGKTSEAVAVMTEAVKQTPDECVLRDHLGVALQALGRPAEALPQFEAAVRLKPGYWEAQIRLGNVLESLGRTAEANEHFAQAFLTKKDSSGVPTRQEAFPFADTDGKDR